MTDWKRETTRGAPILQVINYTPIFLYFVIRRFFRITWPVKKSMHSSRRLIISQKLLFLVDKALKLLTRGFYFLKFEMILFLVINQYWQYIVPNINQYWQYIAPSITNSFRPTMLHSSKLYFQWNTKII